MRVGIIDADLLDHGTRHPNLALMKISGYLRSQGNDTQLILDHDIAEFSSHRDMLSSFDKVVVSKVFDFSKLPRILENPFAEERIMRQGAVLDDYIFKTRGPRIVFGGTGFIPYLKGEMPNHLPNEIEHQKPDYTLYDRFVDREINVRHKDPRHYDDYRYYSIGFTTRGCFRKCKFCVNRAYRYVEPHSPIEEFVDDARPYIYLWDDNFLGLKAHAKPGSTKGGKTWRDILRDLRDTGKPFQFRQGLDIRLMDDEIALALAECRYHGDYIFAFDHFSQKAIITKGFSVWRRHNPRKNTKAYVLCGFSDQGAKDISETFERIRILMTFGVLPYIMRHGNYLTSKYRSLYVQLARWCNQPQFLKKKSFREYCEACQYYHLQGERRRKDMCAAYEAMRQFEIDEPMIARQYYDMKWSDLVDTWGCMTWQG